MKLLKFIIIYYKMSGRRHFEEYGHGNIITGQSTFQATPHP